MDLYTYFNEEMDKNVIVGKKITRQQDLFRSIRKRKVENTREDDGTNFKIMTLSTLFISISNKSAQISETFSFS